MSSHHFVKEGQEPALFILEAHSLERIQSLLEWVPIVLVTESMVDRVLQWGLKIDVVLQYNIPLQELEEKLSNQSPLQLLSCGTANVVDHGLQFLVENNHLAVNLIVEPTTKILTELERLGPQLQVGIYFDNRKWSCIIANAFEKWFSRGSRISIITHFPVKLQLQGLIQTGAEWEATHTGLVRIQSDSPFWIGEWI